MRDPFPDARTPHILIHTLAPRLLAPSLAADCAIGLYGLAVMGQNLALNIAQNARVKIAVANRSPSKV